MVKETKVEELDETDYVDEDFEISPAQREELEEKRTAYEYSRKRIEELGQGENLYENSVKDQIFISEYLTKNPSAVMWLRGNFYLSTCLQVNMWSISSDVRP